jgi:ATP-dependent HslUV protease subunit HslV
MDAMTVAKKAMNIAADTCVYTNHNFIIESIGPNDDAGGDEPAKKGDEKEKGGKESKK